MRLLRKSLALLTMFALLWGSIFSGIDIRSVQAEDGGTQSTGTVIYVKESAIGNGSSWNDAFGTLQQALESAQPGDEIWIAAGTYVPTKTVSDGVPTQSNLRNATFKMRPGVAIYGGFPADAANGTGMSARNWETNPTILSGDLNRDDTDNLEENKSDNANNVFHHPETLALDATAILDGVTITGGNGDVHGAGIRNEGSSSNADRRNNLTLRNIIMTENIATRSFYGIGGSGGGLYNAYGTLSLANVTISNNQGFNGGGINSIGGHIKFTDGAIVDNIASQSGGGIYASNSANTSNIIELTGVSISGNTAMVTNSNDSGGGGIYFNNGTFRATDVTITDNRANSSGGGFISSYGTAAQPNDVELVRVTISNNIANINGGGISSRHVGELRMFGGEVSNNIARFTGGGIYSFVPALKLDGVTIRGNETSNGSGGGIGIENSDSKLINVRLLENKAMNGGGLYIGNATPIFTNVLIQGNTAEHKGDNYQGLGGGIYNYSDANGSGRPILSNVLITGNVANGPTTNGRGGGIYDRGGAFSTLTNVTLAHNYSEGDGGGYYREGAASDQPVIQNSIIWGNKAGNGKGDNIQNASSIATTKAKLHVANSLIENAILDGEWNKEFGTDGGGNLRDNPAFIAPVAPSILPNTSGDYHLEEGSPAIDKGDNTKVPADVTTDLDGGPRIADGVVDLGAYELNLDAEAPTWPAGTETLSVVPVVGTPTSVVVSWPEADDNFDVKSYYLTMDGGQPLEFPGSIFANTTTFEYTIANLPEPKVYTFKLIAVDAAGNESIALIGTYELEEADVEPPAPGTFGVNWSIARTAYPHMLAMPGASLDIVATGEAGQTLQATIHYESWLAADGTELAVPRMVSDTVPLSVDPANSGRYQVQAPLLANAGKIASIDVIAEKAGQQTIVNQAVDLLVAATYTLEDAKTGLGNHLIGSTMMLWSEEADAGSTMKVSSEDTYTFSAIIPHKEYLFKFMEAGTNRPLREPELMNFLPGQTLSEKKVIPAPATLRLGITFAGGETVVPDGLVVTAKVANQIISSKVTDSTLAWTRPASGTVLFGADAVQFQITGMEWPYIAEKVEDITLTAGINDITLDIGYAEEAIIEGVVTLNDATGQALEGIQVTAVQTHPGFSHRSFVSKALTDQDGKYRLQVIANSDVLMQVANVEKQTIVAQTVEIDKGELTTDTTVVRNVQVEPYPGPATVKMRINATYIDGQSAQVWEPDEIDWRTAVHFGWSVKDPRGRSYSGYPATVNAALGEKIEACVKGTEASLPDQCVEATIESTPEGEPVAIADFDLVQTGGMLEGTVVDALMDTAINDWSGSLYLVKDGKLKAVNRSQHGIGNGAKSSRMWLWLSEAGTYELRLTSGDKSYVRQITIVEGESLNLGRLPLAASGMFAGKANNELRIVESELVQGGKLNLRAVYTNSGNEAVSDAEIKIALPHGTTYVTGSAIWNNREPVVEEIEMNADYVLFKVGAIAAGGTGTVQFQVKTDAAVSLSDEIGTTAIISYNHSGAQHKEVLGAAHVPVVQVSLNAPAHTVNKAMLLFGSAPAGSKVDVYTDQLLLGRSIASPAGTWSMEVTLPDRGDRAVYVMEAIATAGADVLSSGIVSTIYDNAYPYLTEMSMEQRDGRKITVDPRDGVAYFPYVMVPGSPYLYELTFSDPDLVSNVWVRMGSVGNLREAKATRGVDGIYRVQLVSPPNGPVYVDYDIDIEGLPEWGDDWRDHILVPAGLDLGMIPQTVLSVEEKNLLETAEPNEVVVQGKTYTWSRVVLPDEVEMSDEMMERLIAVNLNGKEYYTDGLTLQNNGMVFSVYGEDLDSLELIEEEFIVALSDLSSGNLHKTVQRIVPLANWTKIGKSLWEIQDKTAGPIRDVNNDSTSFEDAFQALTDMVNEAAGICDPILRADAQRTLQRIRHEDIVMYDLKVLIAAAPLNILGGIIIDNVKNAVFAEQVKKARKLLDMWLSGNDCSAKPPGSTAMAPKFIHDPSGYVYEAVESNRIEGVQATLLYQDPEANDEWVVWDAEWYLQKNPHWTDTNGRYGWDVPEGMWQVVYEKEGYETAFSEDTYGPIEVLPPHFDVNIPMISYQTPEVVNVESKSDGKYVEITFSRYMALNTFGESRVLLETVCAAGQTACTSEAIEGILTGIIVDPAVDNPDLARTIRFTPNTAMSVGDTIAVTIQSMVQSYAGVPMEDSYTANVAIEETPEEPIDPVDPVDPGPTNPTGPTDPTTPTDPVDPTPPVSTVTEYPIDPTKDQTIVVGDGDGQIVIQVPAGVVDSDGYDLYLSVETVEDETEVSKPNNGTSLIVPVQISLIAYDEAGKKTIITDLLKPIEVTVQLDPSIVNEENASRVAAFIFEQGEWRNVPGAYNATTNTFTLLQDRPGTITIMLTNKTFKDIAGHWAQEIIEVMAGRLIIEGYENDIFDPEASITRAEYVTLLMRVLNIPASKTMTHPFEDVAKGAWYYEIVSAALAEELIEGISDTAFGPDLSITREQIATLLQRAYDKVSNNKQYTNTANIEATLGQYEDAGEISSWARDSMSFAIRSGIIEGRSVVRLAPQATASRAEAAVMLQRFMDLIWDEMNQ